MDPFKKFNLWFKEAKKKHPFDHTAFALSTCLSNKPDVRIVLLKKILKDGYVFFTNLNSLKAKHFEKNKNLSMCFYWESIEKQIRIRGSSVLVETKVSDEYFQTRPRGSRISAWVSDQSSVISNWSVLKKKEKAIKKKFKNKVVPRPEHWGGIKICPDEFEFWERRKFRLHKRELYFKNGERWKKKFLAP